MDDDYQPKPRALWVVTLVFCVVVIVDAWFRWTTFQLTTPDLAFYTQALWRGGVGHSTVLDLPLMGHHAEPICLLLLPFFWIVKHPMTLVVLQTLLLATMPFTGYRIARRLDFERSGSKWLGVVTLLAPVTGFMALHEFHPETLAAPIILLMIEARVAHRPGTFWIWFLLALGCGENVGVMLAWLCAVHYLLERERGREWQMLFNLIPGAVAVGWVALYVFWLGPMWSGGKVADGDPYVLFGGIRGIFTQPGFAMSSAWHGATGGNLVWGMLLPFVFLPFLRLRWLVIAAPLLLQHLLSHDAREWNLGMHYAAAAVPLLWFGAAEACGRLYWREVMAGWIVVACVGCQLWFGPVRAVGRTVWNGADAWAGRRWRKEMLATIPADASVTAGAAYLSHLAKRDRVFQLPIDRGGNIDSDVVVVDVADKEEFGHGRPGYLKIAIFQKKLLENTWRKVSRNEMTLFFREPVTEGAPLTGTVRKLDAGHGLVVAQLAPPAEGDTAEVQLTLELGAGRTVLPWVDFIVESPELGIIQQISKGPIGLGTRTGQVTERWAIRMRLPANVPAGRYPASVLFYDPMAGLDTNPGEVFVKRRFGLGEIEVKR
jgi:uncharacterized membrane protein